MSSSDSDADLARKITAALIAGGSENPVKELGYIFGQFSQCETDMPQVLEQLAVGVSPYHIFGNYQLPSTHTSIEVPRAVMPPGSMTEDVIGIIRGICTSIRPRTMLDLGCGTGVLGIAALMACARMRGMLLDLDWEAAACTRRNLARLGLLDRAAAICSDGAGVVKNATVDLQIANLPFVPDAQVQSLPPRFGVHAPLLAVRGGADGLDVLRRLAGGMKEVAAPGCHLVLQVGNADQKASAARMLETWWKPTVHEFGPHPNVLVEVRRRRNR